MDTPLAARCLQGLGLAYNGCGDAEAALEPLQAARRPSHIMEIMVVTFVAVPRLYPTILSIDS